METYSLLRQFADSWGLLLMVGLFLGVLVYTFRPGSRGLHDDMAQLPLRNNTLAGSTGTVNEDKRS